jgi:ABC-type sugar transport system ATPase subunit
MTAPTALRMIGISKTYPGVVALDGASLDAQAGEATAVMGANGAGKSTLMNVLGGVTRPDAGSIELGGTRVEIGSPRDAARYGIAFVHQELTMLPTLSVEENIFINDFPTRNGLIDKAVMRARSKAILDRLGCAILPERLVGDLSTGDRQMIEIARAMRREPRVIIFDEPTSSLTQPEKRRLFAVIESLKREGVTIIYITHFLNEIFEICERVSVMRGGQTVGGGPIGAFKPADIVRLMLGDVEVGTRLKVPVADRQNTVLEVRGLTRGTALREIGFDLCAGEVVGLWGLLGAGRTELARALVGLDPIDHGTIRWQNGTS